MPKRTGKLGKTYLKAKVFLPSMYLYLDRIFPRLEETPAHHTRLKQGKKITHKKYESANCL